MKDHAWRYSKPTTGLSYMPKRLRDLADAIEQLQRDELHADLPHMLADLAEASRHMVAIMSNLAGHVQRQHVKAAAKTRAAQKAAANRERRENLKLALGVRG